MKRIPLTQGKFALVDDADYDWLVRYEWQALKETNSGLWYASRSYWVDGRTYGFKMHRQIMGLSKGDGKRVDHINGDRLDNRRCNLRLATHAENCRNRKNHSNNTSGFKGVHRQKNRWRALIRVDGKSKFLGSFLTPEDAHAAYCAAARKYFGEFARFS